jgi:hypothetical protein
MTVVSTAHETYNTRRIKMFAADYRAAKAVMEARVEEATSQAGDVGHVQLSSQVALPDLAHRVLRRLALLSVAVGGRLVTFGCRLQSRFEIETSTTGC